MKSNNSSLYNTTRIHTFYAQRNFALINTVKRIFYLRQFPTFVECSQWTYITHSIVLAMVSKTTANIMVLIIIIPNSSTFHFENFSNKIEFQLRTILIENYFKVFYALSYWHLLHNLIIIIINFISGISIVSIMDLERSRRYEEVMCMYVS